ncbi:ABC transporter permease [Propionispora hippei]|uniref:Oligopeptide transport system permease protein n=1 Tax=Propionispora hippei DSM 15287 TaxID=1123003 RepID=A0A1M6BW07_9FIRM|nr:ABC transporter permease [Propionispora hippei]SHI52939.1 oligopeptide transport system permease protein [Propionispora hippei DSM 15287]
MPMSSDLFKPLSRDRQPPLLLPVPEQTAWHRLKENKLAMAGLYAIIVILLLAVLGPCFSSLSYSDQNLQAVNQPPSAAHWFGTDSLGRDLFIRVLYGARISLAIGFVASLINLTLGVLYGGIAGFFGGRIDRIMMHIVDVLYGIPVLLYVILLMVILKPGLTNIFIALGIAYWLNMARIVRGQILQLKEQDYVLAARSLGAGHWRILLRHLLPNSLGPIVITMTLTIPEAIFTEAFLSFIGLGVAAPLASWGVLASDGVTSLRSYPFQLLFPSLAICLTMLAFNFLGDGLRDALDPRVRR